MANCHSTISNRILILTEKYIGNTPGRTAPVPFIGYRQRRTVQLTFVVQAVDDKLTGDKACVWGDMVKNFRK